MDQKYYAVKSGRIPGIYKSWDDCKKQTDGFSSAIYKSFKTKELLLIALRMSMRTLLVLFRIFQTAHILNWLNTFNRWKRYS